MQESFVDTADPKLLGQRLQEARRARGLTQQHVAESMGMARTTVTALEKGDRRIRPGELISLAQLYGRPVGYFIGSRKTVSDFSVQFRTALNDTRGAETQQALNQGVHDFQDLCEDYLYLETVNGMSPQQSYPAQYAVSGFPPEDAAEDVAASERNRLGLGDGPILNLREILENEVGLRIFYADLPSNLAGIFTFTEELGGCIAINARHPEERRRWSLAHEYGHFLTSRFRSEVTPVSSLGRVSATERLADAFAAALLMPATGLRRRFYQISRATEGNVTTAEICRLANYYFVSVEAMMLRLEGLNLLPRGTWERLRDRGFKVREAQEQLGLVAYPHDDDPLPLRYKLLAVQAYEEDELTEGELCRLLRQDRLSTRQTVQSMTNPLRLMNDDGLMAIPIDLSSRVTGTRG